MDPNNSFWLSTTQASVIRDTADSEQITERSETRGCHIGCSTTSKRQGSKNPVAKSPYGDHF